MIHLKTPVNKSDMLRQMKAYAEEAYSESHEKEEKITAYMSGANDMLKRLQIQTTEQPDLPAENTVM